MMWRNAFWVFALGMISTYLFFLALGAFDVLVVWPVSVAVGLMAVAWMFHTYLNRRHPSELRDPRLVHARERRGF